MQVIIYMFGLVIASLTRCADFILENDLKWLRAHSQGDANYQLLPPQNDFERLDKEIIQHGLRQSKKLSRQLNKNLNCKCATNAVFCDCDEILNLSNNLAEDEPIVVLRLKKLR